MSFEFNSEENIFIAGSQGMVGSSIKRELIKLGYKENSIKGKILCPTKADLDLLDYQAVKNWFKKNKPSIVIIAAAKVGGIIANSQNPFEFIVQNLKIQTNIIEIAFINNVKKLLFLGSSCIYPKYSPQPIKESYLLTDSLEPTNEFYAIAKIAGIKLCQSLMIQKQFNSICIMPTNLYGPGDNYHHLNSHVIPSLIRKFYEAKKNNFNTVTCWGTGKPLREFLHVDDLAKASIFLLKEWNPVYDYSPEELRENSKSIINVGSTEEVSIKELANKIACACNYKGQIIWDKDKPDGTPRKKLDITKLSKLGWEPTIKLEAGIKSTIKSFEIENNKKVLRK